MMILVTKAIGTLAKGTPEGHPWPSNVGRLVQPRDAGRVADTPRHGFLWAADNDAFNNFHERRYLTMLDLCAGVPGCLFVAAPDVVGDAEKTFDLFDYWLPELKKRNLPVGFVAQDGIRLAMIEPWWSEIDALFVGGTTEFKLGSMARRIVWKARTLGKWVHMGRVNSESRLLYARSIGCSSMDGTQYSRFTNAYLEKHALMARGEL